MKVSNDFFQKCSFWKKNRGPNNKGKLWKFFDDLND